MDPPVSHIIASQIQEIALGYETSNDILKFKIKGFYSQLSDYIYIEKGQKDEALDGQTDKDLADMAPLRATVAINYEYMNEGLATLTFRASDKWNTYDSDNGEQELGSWSIVNLKVKHTFMKSPELTFGVNNLFDKTYLESNTYADLILVTAGSDVMLVNEPGRYIYTNIKYKF